MYYKVKTIDIGRKASKPVVNEDYPLSKFYLYTLQNKTQGRFQ